jgi:hypothetical protein
MATARHSPHPLLCSKLLEARYLLPCLQNTLLYVHIYSIWYLVMIPSRFVGVYRSFEGNYFFHLQGSFLPLDRFYPEVRGSDCTKNCRHVCDLKLSPRCTCKWGSRPSGWSSRYSQKRKPHFGMLRCVISQKCKNMVTTYLPDSLQSQIL